MFVCHDELYENNDVRHAWQSLVVCMRSSFNLIHLKTTLWRWQIGCWPNKSCLMKIYNKTCLVQIYNFAAVSWLGFHWERHCKSCAQGGLQEICPILQVSTIDWPFWKEVYHYGQVLYGENQWWEKLLF